MSVMKILMSVLMVLTTVILKQCVVTEMEVSPAHVTKDTQEMESLVMVNSSYLLFTNTYTVA